MGSAVHSIDLNGSLVKSFTSDDMMEQRTDKALVDL
jgi:hypothetical protein